MPEDRDKWARGTAAWPNRGSRTCLQERRRGKNIRRIASGLGAHVVGRVPKIGGGAFGAARLAALLRGRLTPSAGLRPGRPTDPNWVKHPKVPMSEATFQRLERLAGQLSTPGRPVSPMQVAAPLLETSVERLIEKDGGAKYVGSGRAKQLLMHAPSKSRSE